MKYLYIPVFFIFIIIIYQLGDNSFSENTPSTNELSATQQEVKKVAIKTDTTSNLEPEKTASNINDSKDVISSKPITLLEDTPTPDELWAIQQEAKQDVVKTNSSSNLASSNSKDNITSSPITPSEDIPTPDELWEQQHQIDRTNDLPATIPEILVISDEQRKAETLANSEKTSAGTGNDILDSENNLDYVVLADDLPPLEPLIELIPFELRELEMLADKEVNKGDDSEVIATDLASPQVLEKKTGQ
jgi:hypothetical protein